MTQELYHKYRPKKLEDLYGMDVEVATLQKHLDSKKFPKALLLHGPTGCGKTSIAYILRKELQCHASDFRELNASASRGIDTIKEVLDEMHLVPWKGPCRIFYFDECQGLTKDAQSAMLKMLEFPPKQVYFFLATTHPSKLLPTIVNRCTQIEVKLLPPAVMKRLLTDTLEKEGVEVAESVIDRIVEVSDGCARQGMNILNKVILLDSESEQLEAIKETSSAELGVSIAQILMDPRKGSWKDVIEVFKKIDDNTLESARHSILGYAGKVLLSGVEGKRAERCLGLNDLFQYPFYDSTRWTFLSNCYRFYHAK